MHTNTSEYSNMEPYNAAIDNNKIIVYGIFIICKYPVTVLNRINNFAP